MNKSIFNAKNILALAIGGMSLVSCGDKDKTKTEADVKKAEVAGANKVKKAVLEVVEKDGDNGIKAKSGKGWSDMASTTKEEKEAKS